jgi:putative ABC transport system substrate-binding protein
MIGRREFVTVLGGAAAWPLAAQAQQPTMPVIGYLDTGSRTENAYLIAAFRQGLSETGFIEDQNIKVEYRFAEGQYDRLPGLASELVRREVAAIAAVGSVPSVLAAQAATATIPIVFTSGGDPLKFGFVTSLNRPNKNMTGVSVFSVALTAKRLEILRELVPNAAVIAALVNPSNPDA